MGVHYFYSEKKETKNSVKLISIEPNSEATHFCLHIHLHAALSMLSTYDHTGSHQSREEVQSLQSI